ncbi:MAG: hypothetical protein MI864_10570, partial [Pseudomonadales bacterium]|nr:hypothetical protein [Pseudomonadales bacterium]
VNPFVEKMFGTPRKREDKLTQYHMDIAATIQEFTNQTFIKLAKEAKKLTNEKTLVISGGVALNSVANGQILKQNLFDEVLAYPHSNDAGTAVGGALWVEYSKLGNKRQNHWYFNHAYLGTQIDSENIESVAEKYDLSYKKVENPAKVAADLISEGKIVGWVQGRAEIGPRALGNRSILGNPANANIKNLINSKVKNRENWRPFAPSVLAEDAALYFDTNQKLPYMIIVADVRPEWRDKIPSVIHVDGTARVQTVDKNVNPRFYELLTEMKRKTGLGMVLNTSFNAGGEPIISTTEQAIKNFLTTEMDALIIDNAVFEDKANAQPCDKFAVHQSTFAALDPTKPLYVLGVSDNSDISFYTEFLSHLAYWEQPVAIHPHLEKLSGIKLNALLPEQIIEDPGFDNASILVLGGQTASHWTFDAYLIRAELVVQGFDYFPNHQILSIAQNGGVSDLNVLQLHQKFMLENGQF